VNWQEYLAFHKLNDLQVLQMCRRTDDLIPQPPGDQVAVCISKLHGLGAFTKLDRGMHEVVGLALGPHLHRTDIIGRYINHAHNPNCYLRKRDDGGYELVALLGVRACDELTIAYEMVDRIREEH